MGRRTIRELKAELKADRLYKDNLRVWINPELANRKLSPEEKVEFGRVLDGIYQTRR